MPAEYDAAEIETVMLGVAAGAIARHLKIDDGRPFVAEFLHDRRFLIDAIPLGMAEHRDPAAGREAGRTDLFPCSSTRG
jgi:hypothetical protein